ncbi:holo-ACP synthase [Desmospora activa]|uniref:Holo-[acyl-carrier-protein] synthase n=1 Tax=Desmospora activa DSM 45169 TaxID=1121389 RepID=A0A2T4Z0S6_9BACL|nr:holo-ACP synthase [Desmospora activa]PTM53310.1 holo-[acyl-carrier-protein] synthase [Desmospora activa DSM 45169]
MIVGIGTDSISCARIAAFGPQRLAKRILTPEEQAYLPTSEKRRIEWMAGRFAAKEALSKAAGTGIGAMVNFCDITVLPDERGKPIARLSKVAQTRLGWNSDIAIHLSITHTEEQATAFVVVEQRD